MTLGSFGEGIIGNLLASKLYDLLNSEAVIISKTPAVRRAIHETAERFPDLELKPLLEIWCESESFQALVAQGKAESINDDEVLTSFVTISRFQGDYPLAHEILSFFFERFRQELAASAISPASHDGQEAIRAAATQSLVIGKADETQHLIQDGNHRLLQVIGDLRDEVSGRRDEVELKNIIDQACETMKGADYTTARGLLLSARELSKGKVISNDLNYRLAANIGSCALQLGDERTASEELEAAFKYKSDTAPALSSGAIAAHLRGDYEVAIDRSERALLLQPCEANAISIKIQALWRTKSDTLDSFVKEIDECLQTNPMGHLALATIRVEQDRWVEARRLAYRAAKAVPTHPDANLIYAQCLFVPLRQSNLEGASTKAPRVVASTLSMAEEAQSKAIELLRGHPKRDVYGQALLDRAAIRLARGDIKGCLADCKIVLQDAVISTEIKETATLQEGVAYIRLGNDDEGARILESLSDPQLRRQAIGALAFALLKLNRPKRVLEVVSDAWEPELKSREQLEIAEYLLEAHRSLGNKQAEDKVFRQIKEQWKDDPQAAIILAAHLHRLDNVDEAIKLLRTTRDTVPSQSQIWNRLTRNLAEMLFRQQKFDESLPLFEAVVDTHTAFENPTLVSYLLALFHAQKRSGALNEALTIARNLRDREGIVEQVAAVEAAILYEAGRFEESRTIYLKLAELYPDFLPHRLRAIQLAIFLKKDDEARAELLALKQAPLGDDPFVLMQIAEFQAHVDELDADAGSLDALDYAYQALRLGFGEAEIHRAYISIFMNVTRQFTGEGSSPLDSPAEVEVNSGVRLEREGESKSYTILDRGPHSEDRGEILPTHLIAKKLLGLRRGERLTLHVGARDFRYEVAEVLHPYVIAFQDCIKNFSNRFAENRKMMTLHVAENDLSEVFSVLDDGQRSREGLLQLYRDWKIPICFFAQHNSRSIFEAWEALRIEPNAGIHSDSGRPNEEQDAQLLRTAKCLVLDATSLITASQLGIVAQVKEAFGQLVVAPTLAQSINAAVHDVETDDSVGRMGRSPLGYFFHQVTTEQREAWRKFVTDVRNQMATHANVVPRPGLLSLNKRQHRQIEDSIGSSALDSLLNAKEDDRLQAPTTLFWSDDAGLRDIGRELKIPGVSTFRVLVELRNRRVLTTDEFYTGWQRLILLGYKFLPVNAEFLTWALERENFRITPEVRAVFSSLNPPTVQTDAISVAADVLRLVWQKKQLHILHLDILDLCLEVLTRGRNTWEVVENFKNELARRFQLFPVDYLHIRRDINSWARTHLQSIERSIVLPDFAQNRLEEEQRATKSSVDDDSLLRAAQSVEGSAICLLSALQFHVLTTQNPFEIWLAVPDNTSQTTITYPPVRRIGYPKEMLIEGIDEHFIEGISVRITNPARTIVDCFKFRNDVGLEVALDALRECYQEGKGTIVEFRRYATMWGIEKEIQPYLESLV